MSTEERPQDQGAETFLLLLGDGDFGFRQAQEEAQRVGARLDLAYRPSPDAAGDDPDFDAAVGRYMAQCDADYPRPTDPAAALKHDRERNDAKEETEMHLASGTSALWVVTGTVDAVRRMRASHPPRYTY